MLGDLEPTRFAEGLTGPNIWSHSRLSFITAKKVRSKISKGKNSTWGEVGGKPGAMQGPLPGESHRTFLWPQILTAPQGAVSQGSSTESQHSGFYWGLVTWHLLLNTYQNSRL